MTYSIAAVFFFSTNMCANKKCSCLSTDLSFAAVLHLSRLYVYAAIMSRCGFTGKARFVLGAQTAVKVDVTSLRASSRRRQDKAVVVVISASTLARDVIQTIVQRIGMEVKQASMMQLVSDIVVRNGTTQGDCRFDCIDARVVVICVSCSCILP